jgi:hypothetical protein
MTLDLLRGLGWLVPVAVLVPNVLWALLPGASRAAPRTTALPQWVRWVEPVEWVGRMAVFILPVLCHFKLGTMTSVVALWAMLLTLLFYYLGWLRYFSHGREPVQLYRRLLGVPLPLAVSPVVYFLAASLVLRSRLLAIAAVVFGAAHVTVGWAEYECLKSDARAAGQPPS